ncbi:zinc finger protein 664 [Drosophila ficusphila]|uniref:zinc finger protein 664 n=1 Tax=Drosophila ficusphila TaxID=30025 RepID=UPI0007E7E16A|nr:zinc finger protein 664 [Drosophila ficusphila]
MEDLCRVCGTHSNNLMGIFDQHQQMDFEGDEKPDLAEMVKSCADVQLDPGDSLPQKICIACVHDARTAYGFKRRCEESYQKFYWAISNPQIIKEEPEGDYLVIEELYDENLDLKGEFIEESQPETVLQEESPKIAVEKNRRKPKGTIRARRKQNIKTKQSFKCEICIKEFKHQRKLQEHMKVHSNSHFCKNCGEMFLFKSDLDKHLCYHNSYATVECPVCLKVFSTTQSLDSHECQEMKFRTVQCPYCPQTFPDDQNLKVHLLIHTAEECRPGPHKCTYCGVGFTNKSALQVHINAHIGERPHCCPFCESNFRSKHGLIIHIRTHTGEKPYKCATCSKRFSDNNNLAKHRRRHTGERPYKCTICMREFREKHHVKRHLLAKHRDSEQ